MAPVKITVFFYNRLFDPLIFGNFWVFIEDLQLEFPGKYNFHFITYEDETHPLTTAQLARLSQMEQLGITWTKLNWHRGTSFRSKLIDVISGFWAIATQRMRGSKHIISYNSVAGSFCYLYASTLRMKLFMYSFEPHSEYSVDNGMLSENSSKYKILSTLERRAAQFSSVISSGTSFMERRLKEEWHVQGAFFKIPSVTDERKFRFNSNMRNQRRSEIGIDENRRVLFYPGKFGDLYYGKEIAQMFRWLLDEDPNLFFLVLTPQPREEIQNLFHEADVPLGNYFVASADYDCVETWFWAADFGIIAVPPGPSKKFISNIKVGEYLCSGLPFLITHGVSEDYLFALKESVGVVVDDFSEKSVRDAWPKIQFFLEQDPETRRAHCTFAGVQYRAFTTLKPRFHEALDTLIGKNEL